MRKINKELSKIPQKLNGETTNKRREELIKKKEYIYHKNYDSRYKTDDVKKKLHELYHKKCVYCERKELSLTVEHFRPKSKYYWLAYSWDNLLGCCQKCNSAKKDKFEVLEKANIDTINISDIHNLGKKYNSIEKNKLVNPEQEDVSKEIYFDERGFILSENERVKYTIETCNLNNDSLVEERRKLFEDFEQELTVSIEEIKAGNEKADYKLEKDIEKFENTAADLSKSYTLLRNFIINEKLERILNQSI